MDVLAQLLNACLESDANVRSQAEKHLEAASLQPGFGPALAQLILSNANAGGAHAMDVSQRQMAAVVLKKYILEHWEPSDAKFREPACNDPDKAAIRHILPQALADPSSKMRSAVSMAIAAVARFDFPNSWPGILEWMVSTVSEQRDHNLVLGTLRCLSMIAEDIDEKQLPQLIPVLLPSLLKIASNPQYDLTVKRNVLSILHSILAQLSYMQGAFQKEVRDLLAPQLQPWLPVLIGILATPMTKDPSTWQLQLSVLQLSVALLSHFGRSLGDMVQALLAPCWATFTGPGLQLYQEVLVSSETEGEDDVEPSEGEEAVGLEAVLSQMFEVLLCIVGNPRLRPLLAPVTQQLAYTTIKYMQITATQAEEWHDNPNAFVADEEESMFTCRVSGELLINELCTNVGWPAVAAVMNAIQTITSEAEATRQLAPGNPSPSGLPQQDWWKLREAALLAAGSVPQAMDSLKEGVAPATFGAKVNRKDVIIAGSRLTELLKHILENDLQGASSSSPFLVSRSLWTASKLMDYMPVSLVEAYFNASCTAIRSSNFPMYVRIGGCHCLVQLLPRLLSSMKKGNAGSTATPADLAPALPGIYEGLVLLLKESSEETAHLVLETLEVVIKHDSTCVVQQYLQAVATPVLHVWEACVADPVVGEDAMNVLAMLASKPPCLAPLVSELLPALTRVLSSPAGQKPMMVEGSLGLLSTIVKKSRPVRQQQSGEEAARHLALVQGIYVSVAGPVVALIETSSDNSVQQEAQGLLCQLIRGGRSHLLSWQGLGSTDPPSNLSRLLNTTARLLSGAVPELESALAGHLAADIISSFPPEMVQQHIPQLLQMVVQRLVQVNTCALVSGLLIFLSKLAQSNCNQVVDALAAMTITDKDGQSVNALHAVIPIWCERACDVHGRYYTALVTTALGALLECDHPQLAGVMVRGKRVDTQGTAGGVQTRSQARSQISAAGGEQYSSVHATVKIAAALAGMLVAAKEVSDADALYGEYEEGEDDDDDWESGDDDDGNAADDDDDDNSPNLAVMGASAFNTGQNALLNQVLSDGQDTATPGKPAWLNEMVLGDAVGGDLDDVGPLSPGSVLRDEAVGLGADDAAPPGDPLAALDVGQWVGQLFQRLALTDQGKALIQAAMDGAMSRKQATTVQEVVNSYRLRPGQ